MPPKVPEKKKEEREIVKEKEETEGSQSCKRKRLTVVLTLVQKYVMLYLITFEVVVIDR